jgi:hypothetical protein
MFIALATPVVNTKHFSFSLPKWQIIKECLYLSSFGKPNIYYF